MTPANPFLDRDLFEDERFSGLELPRADFSAREFVRCTFTKLILPESSWKGARLDDCVFDGCDLSRMRPAGMGVRGVTFVDCRLAGIEWTGLGPAPSVAFDGCNLQYASFVDVNLGATRFARCRIVEAHFIGARLVDADFTDSDLSGSRFEHCDARRANFADARGLSIDPAKNKVKGARISMAAAAELAASFGLRVAGYGDAER